MKTNETQIAEPAKTAILTMSVLVFLIIILSAPGAGVIGISGAALLTIAFGLHSHHFRSRRGSLTPAYCLLAFVWLCAAVTILFPFLSRH